MFVYGDYDYRSPIRAATDQIDPMEQLLFPFMNFTCSGRITRLMFVARKSIEFNNINHQNYSVTSWPMFSLWHRVGNNFMWMQRLGPTSPSQLQITSQTIQSASSGSTTGDRQDEVVVINFTMPNSIPFGSGYILGLRQNSLNTSSNQPSWNIKVLRQSGGYGLKLHVVCDGLQLRRCPVDVMEYQEVPYIAVETSM